ncbi:alpha/beta hydrolase [Lacrimispora saccharolytica]|uniref:Alpha/beta hydrolase fold protein n=1 Tax=Lacrimispora saccharolytica (strain ATCC 35040 / DSM 2544 / NRCC 2533 / WM1) TaxID=610130 RepID=D9R2P9_LACSW|nr:alpha/beta hydrolase [Lacrimispora saccharolytica]ADL06673.1 alpha/beta hydrolase fold protein [[Clostridium] saccharolyticum WM1]QRV19258.1 lysophospholipase [Lacrimispora saccharolytica]
MGEMISSFDGTRLFLNREVPETARGAAVIVHGLCEHQGRYDYVAKLCHEAGIATYRFDHRGHGRSEGERTYYEDFNELLDDTNVVVDMAIRENPDIPVFLIGHSMGGFTVSLYGAKYTDKKIRGIITSGALTKDTIGLISSVPKGLDPHTKLPNELGAGVCSVAEVTEWYGKDPYNSKTFTTGLCYALCQGLTWFEEAAARFEYPILMLHGEKDGLVSVQDTYGFFAAAPSKDKQMKIYGGLFHEIFNEYCRDEVIQDALHWIQARISR